MNGWSHLTRFVAIAGLGLSAGSASNGTTAAAAPIVWGSPQTVSGDADVSTAGTTVYAYNIGASGVSSTTVNGVTFLPFVFPATNDFIDTATTGSVTFRESPGALTSFSNLGAGTGSYSGLSSAYKSLLDYGGSATVLPTISGTLGGLTNGQQYQIQLWASNAALTSGAFGTTMDATVVDAATNSVTLDTNTTNTVGGLGQYLIGTFTANGTTQVFTLDGDPTGGDFSKSPLINAFQVRAVPEPTTYALALAGLACGGVSMWRRQRHLARTKLTCGKAVARASAIVATCMTCSLMRSADAVPTLADISWGSATNISGDSDVDTIGTLVYAYNFGSGTSATTQTINGVTFQPFVIDTGTNSQTTGNVTVSEDAGYLGSDSYLGSGTTPFSGLGSSYGSLLSSEVYANNSATMRFDLGGLTPGNAYRLQWWTNDSALITGAESSLFFENTIASGSSSAVTLDSNTSGVNGGLGQYVIGTFTASDAMESFTLVGSGTSGLMFPMMNALQVRAVPEPSTCIMALAGLACGGYALFRRRNRA